LFKDAQEAAELSGFEQEIAKITKVKGRTRIGNGPAVAHRRQLKEPRSGSLLGFEKISPGLSAVARRAKEEGT
jgi:hypothetical protein